MIRFIPDFRIWGSTVHLWCSRSTFRPVVGICLSSPPGTISIRFFILLSKFGRSWILPMLGGAPPGFGSTKLLLFFSSGLSPLISDSCKNLAVSPSKSYKCSRNYKNPFYLNSFGSRWGHKSLVGHYLSLFC